MGTYDSIQINDENESIHSQEFNFEELNVATYESNDELIKETSTGDDIQSSVTEEDARNKFAIESICTTQKSSLKTRCK